MEELYRKVRKDMWYSSFYFYAPLPFPKKWAVIYLNGYYHLLRSVIS